MGGVLFVFTFIPIFSTLAGICFLMLAAADISDYALEVLELKLSQRVRFFLDHFAVFLGFGMTMGVVFLIPGLNFFLLPASVAGASELVSRLAKSGRIAKSRSGTLPTS
jgi:uncharacterized protein involved in cysteine biosynthesis